MSGSEEFLRRQQDAIAGRIPKLKAYCVLFNPGRSHHLVCLGIDPRDGSTIHRLLGGHVEFGEYSLEAVVREISEELGVTIVDPGLLAVVENVYDDNKLWGHEVIFVYVTELSDPLPIPMGGGEFLDDGVSVACVWRSVADEATTIPLHPEGLAERLASVQF